MITVLHVDDSSEDSELFFYQLKRVTEDIDLKWVNSGEDALKLIAENPPDCIISDYQMPVMNGLELLQQLRALGQEVPFIFYTGQGNEELAAKALRAGADDYFTKEKGFAHFDRLLNSIERVVKASQESKKRKAAESSLKKAEKEYRELFEQAGDNIFLIDPDGWIIRDVNKSACKRHGYSREEMVGKSILDFVSDPAHDQALIDGRFELFKTAERVVFETSHRCKDGTDFPVEVSAKVADIGGKPIIISVERDISEKKLAEQSKIQYEREREIIYRISREINTTLELESVLQILSDGAAELLNIETSAIYLKDGEEFYLWAASPPLPGDVHDEMRRARLENHPHIDKAIATQEPISIFDARKVALTKNEYEATVARGIKSLLFLPFNHGNDVVGVLIVGTRKVVHNFSDYETGLCRTISNLLATSVQNAMLHTSVKEQNEELLAEIDHRKNTEKALRKSEIHLSNALKLGRLGHWEFFPEENEIELTDEWYSLLKTSAEDVGGYRMSPQAFLKRFIHPEDHAEIDEHMQMVLESSEIESSTEFSHKLLFPDNSVGFALVRYKAIYNESGKLDRVVGITQDISDHNRVLKGLKININESEKQSSRNE